MEEILDQFRAAEASVLRIREIRCCSAGPKDRPKNRPITSMRETAFQNVAEAIHHLTALNYAWPYVLSFERVVVEEGEGGGTRAHRRRKTLIESK